MQVLAEHPHERGVVVNEVVMNRRFGIGEQQKSHAICGRVRSRESFYDGLPFAETPAGCDHPQCGSPTCSGLRTSVPLSCA